MADYAALLCVTAKHLSETVQATTGRTASAWLDDMDMVLPEAKVQLKQTARRRPDCRFAALQRRIGPRQVLPTQAGLTPLLNFYLPGGFERGPTDFGQRLDEQGQPTGKNREAGMPLFFDQNK